MNLPYLVIPSEPTQPNTWQPRVSFCIPTKNRARTIAACLASIRAQDYPDIEIIVVDNGSTDETVAIAQRYADRVASCDGKLGAVRQHSIDLSSGTILALFDDDIIIPHTGWLRQAVAIMHSAESYASTLWPVLIPPPTAGWVTRCFFALNDAIYAARYERPSAVFGGGNSLFLRSAVQVVGGFNPAIGFGEDYELATKLKQAGYHVILHADPLIHDTMYSLREMYRKQRWGADAIQQHGATLLAQSYRDAAHEQILVGFKAMLRGLLMGHWHWLAYPLLLAAKLLPYSQAVVVRTIKQWNGGTSSIEALKH